MRATETEALVRCLEGGIQGQVCLESEAWATDFGGVFEKIPRVVVKPRQAEDVLHCFKSARELDIPVSFRGAGHSNHGQSLSDQGILIENYTHGADYRVLDSRHIEVRTRSNWFDLQKALTKEGRSIPVLTDYLHLSVGGTLSVGGYGVHSIGRGAQVDHVSRLELILPDQTVQWVSPDEHPELFYFSLAALGQIGFIERVVMDTIPYRQFSHLHQHAYGRVSELVDVLSFIAEGEGAEASFFMAGITPNERFSICGVESTEPTAKDGPEIQRICDRLSSSGQISTLRDFHEVQHLNISEKFVTSFDDHYRVWADYVLDIGGLKQFLSFVNRLLATRRLFADSLQAIYILPIKQSPPGARFPFEARGRGAQPVKFGCGLYTMIPKNHRRALDAVTQSVRDCLEVCLKLKGRPYLFGWHDLDAVQKYELYGSDLERLLRLKQIYDPYDLLQSPL